MNISHDDGCQGDGSSSRSFRRSKWRCCNQLQQRLAPDHTEHGGSILRHYSQPTFTFLHFRECAVGRSHCHDDGQRESVRGVTFGQYARFEMLTALLRGRPMRAPATSLSSFCDGAAALFEAGGTVSYSLLMPLQPGGMT